jgi:hypothetical protein
MHVYLGHQINLTSMIYKVSDLYVIDNLAQYSDGMHETL